MHQESSFKALRKHFKANYTRHLDADEIALPQGDEVWFEGGHLLKIKFNGKIYYYMAATPYYRYSIKFINVENDPDWEERFPF